MRTVLFSLLLLFPYLPLMRLPAIFTIFLAIVAVRAVQFFFIFEEVLPAYKSCIRFVIDLNHFYYSLFIPAAGVAQLV